MFGLARLLDLADLIHCLRPRIARSRREHGVWRYTPSAEALEFRIVPTLLGQQLFPSDYPWNQNISNAPAASNSAAVIAHIGTTINVHPDWGNDNPANGDVPLYGIPVNIVHGNTTPKINVIIDNYPGESDILPVPIPANAVIEGDYQDGPNPNGGGYNSGQRGDSHLIIWDEDNNIAYELFGVTRPTDPTLFPNGNNVELPHTDDLWHAAQETVWNMNTDSFRSLGDTSADAAGLSILAGLARPDEGLPVSQGGQGAIDHALRFTLPEGNVLSQYIYPASHVVNASYGSDDLPLGARLRLEDTPAVNAMIASMGPEAQIIAHAMQQYGLVLADIGSAMYVSGTSGSVDANNNLDLVWNMSDVLGLEQLDTADFQVVHLTPIVSSLSTPIASPGMRITITGQNFSGAAGHLSVLFGTTASPSVTYVSDTQIRAVVPGGSGQVNVTVQSGVVETDPNNPNDNVNNPIFGYGVSAVTAADSFTFLADPVSAANSTFSASSSSDVSGVGDLLTIVVKDAGENGIAGLPSDAFSFSLSSGSSAGTFTAVTPTAIAGVYTTTFTGSRAGSATTMTATVAGVQLTDTATVAVQVGPVNATRSTLTAASSQVVAGATDLLTLIVKDVSGNAITGLPGSAFSFALAGGGSAGSISPVIETVIAGTYTATLTGTTSGTASTLRVTVANVLLNSHPTLTVSTGPVSASASTVRFASATLASGQA